MQPPRGTAPSPGPAAETPWGERLRQIRWTLRRWSLRHMVYRLRLPIRRRRWSRERETLCRPFRKSDAARRTSGPALVFGEFSGTHGLGRAAAYDLELLRGRHDEIMQVDIGPYLAGEAPKPLRLGRSFANVYFFCQPDTYGTVCRLIDPREIADAWRVGRWVWETPLFPDAWRFAEGLVHEVWTPSDFCARTFRAVLKIPVQVVPHAVTPPRHDTGIDMRARLGVAPDAFMGLAIMDIRSCPERKNPCAHVRAWKAAFGDDPACVLVMKLRVGRHTAMVLSELRELVGTSGNVLITAQDMSSDETPPCIARPTSSCRSTVPRASA